MRKLLLTAMSLFSLVAYAQTAEFTGQSRIVTNIGGFQGIECQYRAENGRVFWESFQQRYSCPATLEVY